MQLSSDYGNRPEVWTHVMVTAQAMQGPLGLQVLPKTEQQANSQLLGSSNFSL